MNTISVKLLWYDTKYGRGVVEDENGLEYYIDDSVLQFSKTKLIKNTLSRTGMKLILELNENIKNCRCGKKCSN